MIRLVCALLIICAGAVAVAAQTATPPADETTQTEPAERELLRIGVRRNAQPFSYKVPRSSIAADIAAKSGPLRSQSFHGYMVYICDEVLKEMLLGGDKAPRLLPGQIKPVDVDEKMEELVDVDDGNGGVHKVHEKSGTPINSRLDLLGLEFDILCDPATITRDRVKRYMVSPPLFLTGVSYLTLKRNVPPRQEDYCRKGKALIGVVGGTTAQRDGLLAILSAGKWVSYRDAVISVLRNTGDDEACKYDEAKDGQKGLIWPFTTHKELARAFCDGNVDYYVGDLEIITENARGVPGCDIKRGSPTFTNDRYAIYALPDYRNNPDTALLIGRFYEILNREIATADSLLDQAYAATFLDAPKSRKLEVFYWAMRGAR